MHVLAVTNRTQDEVFDDQQSAVPGELARFPLVQCDAPGCACARAFIGLGSRGATTSVEVVDRSDLTAWDYWVLLSDELVDQLGPTIVEVADVVGLVAELVRLLQIAASLPVGTVLGHHAGTVTIREHGPP